MIVRQALAEYAHTAWAGWMRYLFSKSHMNDDGSMTIPPWAVERWSRQAGLAYDALPENEQMSDLKEADRMLEIIAATTPDAPTQPIRSPVVNNIYVPPPAPPGALLARILPPMIWGRVHFVNGDTHVPAIITDPAYAQGQGMPDAQHLVVFPVGEPPFTTVATIDPDGNPATWHWPEQGQEPA